MKKIFLFLSISFGFGPIAFAQLNDDTKPPLVKTASGQLQGTNVSGIRTFKGIPFAQPPVGDLRWKEPQPVKAWDGIRKADQFGPRAMQPAIYADMVFRSNGMSEDCLYLNVWTAARSDSARLPVIVYFFGGGFKAGDGSEGRYDGESMARQGIVAITVNFRLGVFGFFAHPELSKESVHHVSGNYGLMDETEALRWVRHNIAAFGGDSTKVTIAGESAGSFAVSAQMVSPLSKNLIAAAIGESGSLLGLNPNPTLAEAEKAGAAFANNLGAKSLAALRALPAEQLIAAANKPEAPDFSAIVDGYFFPAEPVQLYARGEQAQVPLLIGWNAEESNYKSILGQDPPTRENYIRAVQKIYGDHSEEVLKVYTAGSDEDVLPAATDLASARFIAYSAWKWSDLHSRTGGQKVFRYLYTHARPAKLPQKGNSPVGTGAVHSAEIEYAMGNLPTNRVYDWQPEDYKVSAIMQAYFANFIKNGDPNGLGLPVWPALNNRRGPADIMNIDVNTRTEPEKNRAGFMLLEQVRQK